MNLAFEIGINYLQGIIMIAFMRMRLNSKRHISYIADAAFAFAIGSIQTVYTLIPVNISDTFVLIVPFLYTVVTDRGTWFERILWTFILGTVMTLTVTLCVDLYGAGSHALEESFPLRIGFVLSVNTLTILLLFIIGKAGSNCSAVLIPGATIIILAVLLILQFISADIMYIGIIRTDDQDVCAVISSISMLLCTITTCVLYEIMNRSAMKHHKVELRQKAMEMSRTYQADIESIYKRMMIAQHDLQHQINTANELLSRCGAESVGEVSEKLRQLAADSSVIVTGCIGADAILTAKKTIAEQNQIDFIMELCPLGHLPFDETSFCILLTNILDNAIHGTSMVDNSDTYKRSIHLRLTRARDMFCISCKNTFAFTTVALDFKTAGLHGLGKESIQQIVSEHHGTCSFSSSSDIYSVFITVPYEEGSNV